MKATVRKQFAFLPPLAWALAIDALDLLPNLINLILTPLGGLGLVGDFGFDVVQSFIALVIFEDPLFGVLNTDIIAPPGFDLLPAYTLNVVLLGL